MRLTILVLLLFFTNATFGTQVTCHSIGNGKFKFITSFSNDEYHFKYKCIALNIEEYLQKLLSKKEYESFPKIEVTLFETGSEDWLRIQRTKTSIIFHDNHHATKRILQLTKYLATQLMQKTKTQEKQPLNQTVTWEEIEQLYQQPLDRWQQKHLAKPYYRSLVQSEPYNPIRDTSLYGFANDSITIYCKKKQMLKLQNLACIVHTSSMGTLLFDTDSSFYHLYPFAERLSDDPALKNEIIDLRIVYGKISKRHTITNVKSSYFQLHEVDHEHHRIVFQTPYYVSGKYPEAKHTGHRFCCSSAFDKKKFIYLLDEDFLISDYETLVDDMLNKKIEDEIR